MKTNRLFKLAAGIIIGLMTLSSCEKVEDVDIDNNDYELFLYAAVPNLPSQTSISKSQEEIFKLFSGLYNDRLKSTPGYIASKEEGYFKIQDKTLSAAIQAVQEQLKGIQSDFDAISERVGFDVLTKIDFAFVIQVGYQASDKSIAAFYTKIFGEEYYIQ